MISESVALRRRADRTPQQDKSLVLSQGLFHVKTHAYTLGGGGNPIKSVGLGNPSTNPTYLLKPLRENKGRVWQTTFPKAVLISPLRIETFLQPTDRN